MPKPENTKQERILIDGDALSKQKLGSAACYSHKKLSDFVLDESLAVAENIINQYEQITLSNTDWTLFLNALENPPTKNAKLQEAVSLHGQVATRDPAN